MERVVGASAHIGQELHALRRRSVLRVVDGVEAVLVLVEVEALLAAREAPLLGGAGADLPRQDALGDGDDLFAPAALHLRVGRREREHGAVVAVHVVAHGEAIQDRILDIARFHALVWGTVLDPAQPLGVAARHVARAHDVAHDEDVLRLGDDGLGAAHRHR